MITPRFVRKSVGFIGVGRASNPDMVGTAFLLHRVVPPISGLRFYYLVTAAHLINGARENDVISIRLNPKKQTEPWEWKPLGKRQNWFFRHEYEPGTVDVAVLPFDREEVPKYDLESVDFEAIATADDCEKNEVGPGEDFFIAGWFELHSGRFRNIPIVRVGNIAAMPDERVHVGGVEMDAYLIEARSIGGISGSPVFVNIGGVRPNGIVPPAFQLLGLVHGYFDHKPRRRKRTQQKQPKPDVDSDEGREGVNMGIGIVVPGQKIRDVIGQPGIREPEEREVIQIRGLDGSAR
jgi:hypothetical protein